MSSSYLTLQLMTTRVLITPTFHDSLCSNQWLQIVCPKNHFEASE